MNHLELVEILPTGQKVLFRYRFKDEIFIAALTFSSAVSQTDPRVAKLLQYAGLVSCYHLFDLAYFDEIRVPFSLTEAEVHFFEKLYFNGLAEFRLRNKVDIVRATHVVPSAIAPAPIATPLVPPQNIRPLLLNGGGKDGAVGAEMLTSLGIDFEWFTYQPLPARQRIIQASGNSAATWVKKTNNPEAKSFHTYHGHKPLSGQLAIYAMLAAVLEGRNSVIAANEFSANFDNLIHDGVVVNHQYTKSFAFEQDVHALFRQHVDPELYYFSIGRPFYDLQIIDMFTEFPKYHAAFLSCNRSIRDDAWCLDCPKCAFVILGVSATAPEVAKTIWGTQNPLSSPKLFTQLLDLINETPKPFDCVGTKDEAKLALLQLSRGVLNDIFSTAQKTALAPYLTDLDYTALRNEIYTLEGRAHLISPELWETLSALPWVQKVAR
ncbi:MAG TPA: hypothetical protein VLF60_00230 [Candidatus Saccharimonadales bacterium]|nr:hypothetical protein [Candidatus Saccharimonadales bacterium]